MVISWNGEGCFRIQSGEVVLMTDLPDESSGITAPRSKSDIYIKTINPWPFPFAENHKNSDLSIFGGGEYDHKDVRIRGFNLTDESSQNFFKSVYVINWDDVSIGILGHISSDPSPQILEKFEEVDVLIAPAGGEPFFPQEKLVKFIKQLNPKIFIPSFFKIPGLKRKTSDIKKIVEEFNGEAEETDKFVFKKKDIQDLKKTKLVCLKV